jgi:hypothetical protein
VYCAVALDAWWRRWCRWSIGSSQTAALVPSALDMAIRKLDSGKRGHMSVRRVTSFLTVSQRRRMQRMLHYLWSGCLSWRSRSG